MRIVLAYFNRNLKKKKTKQKTFLQMKIVFINFTLNRPKLDYTTHFYSVIFQFMKHENIRVLLKLQFWV